MIELYFATGVAIGMLIMEIIAWLRVQQFKKDLMSSAVARKIIEDIKESHK